MTAIEATNRGLADMPWAMLTSAPTVDAVDVDGVAGARTARVSWWTCGSRRSTSRATCPGALNVPQADLASRLEELPRDRPLLVICQHGMRSLRAAQFLKQAGFTNVATVTGGTSAWFSAGRPMVTGEMPVKPPRVVESLWPHAGAMSAFDPVL